MAFPSVDITGDGVPASRQVRIDSDVVTDFTATSPARLRIRFTNEGDTSRDFHFGSNVPFGPFVSTGNGSSTILVLPDLGEYAHAIPNSPEDGCWHVATEYAILDRGIIWEADPGETTSQVYVGLNDPENTQCLPEGEYRFENQWGEEFGVGDYEWYSWGFTLSLER